VALIPTERYLRSIRRRASKRCPHDFADGAYPLGGLIQDSTANFYGNANANDVNDSGVFSRFTLGDLGPCATSISDAGCVSRRAVGKRSESGGTASPCSTRPQDVA
jgi:hypothetical protein